jgi:clan AA aspartic protease (TIGR02281 family)
MTGGRGRALATLAFVFVTGVGASVFSLNEAGMAAYTRGDYAEAEHRFRQAVASAPREPLYVYHLAVALTRLGRYREAAEAYEAALRLSPEPTLASAARQGLRELAVTTAPRRPPAEPEEAAIPLEASRGGWVTRVKLNDMRSARFLVDTGASVTVLSPELASELRIRPDSDAPLVTFRGLGGEKTARLVRIPSIRVGDIEATDVIATIIDTGLPYDGILGNTFLARFTVQLDPRRGVMSLRAR